MKRTFYLFTALSLFTFSCLPIKKIAEKEESIYIIDFTKYSNQGFYITPEQPFSKYKPIGLFDYTYIPGARYQDSRIENPLYNPKNPAGYTRYMSATIWVQNGLDLEYCLDTIVNRCSEMGANSICNFKIISVERELTGIANPGTLSGVKISGFAIMRED